MICAAPVQNGAEGRINEMEGIMAQKFLLLIIQIVLFMYWRKVKKWFAKIFQVVCACMAILLILDMCIQKGLI